MRLGYEHIESLPVDAIVFTLLVKKRREIEGASDLHAFLRICMGLGCWIIAEEPTPMQRAHVNDE